jgi:DNA primase
MSKSTFVDFRSIKAAVSMERVLRHYGVFETLHGSGETRRGPCPVHGGSNKNQFSVNLAKNIWNCFSDCKGGGNVLDFVSRREGVDIHKAALLLCEWFALNSVSPSEGQAEALRPSTSRQVDQQKPATAKVDDKAPNKPLGFVLKDLNPAHPYLAERGVPPELAADFGIGFYPGSKGLMVGRVVIPIFNREGELVAYAGRIIGNPPDDDVPKYKLPPGFKKGQEVYNLHRAIQQPDDQTFVVVEGFFGCIHLWKHGAQRTVALMGTSMSSEQEEAILKSTSERTHIVIALDENDAGRAGRVDIAARLALHRFVRVHQFEKEEAQPTDLSAEQIKALLSIGRTP